MQKPNKAAYDECKIYNDEDLDHDYDFARDSGRVTNRSPPKSSSSSKVPSNEIAEVVESRGKLSTLVSQSKDGLSKAKKFVWSHFLKMNRCWLKEDENIIGIDPVQITKVETSTKTTVRKRKPSGKDKFD